MKKNKNLIIALFSFVMLFVLICFIPFNAVVLIPQIEQSVSDEIGVNVHIDRLILRFGPYLKLKAPSVHLLYKDGKEFAQLDNVKFYISWANIIKGKKELNKIQAKKVLVNFSSNDDDLFELFNRFANKELKKIPSIGVKEYIISYLNNEINDVYTLDGYDFQIAKTPNYNSFQLLTKGSFKINNIKHLSYDFRINPQLDFELNPFEIDIIKVITQIKELDFHSDIIADLKLYKSVNNMVQASGSVNIDNVSILDPVKKHPKTFVYLTFWGDKASILSNIYTSIDKKIYIEGMVNNSKKTSFDIKVKADEIDLSDLYKKFSIIKEFSYLKDVQSVDGTLNANFSLKGDLDKIKSNGFLKITNASVNASSVLINNINSDIDFSNNAINIKKAIGYINNAPAIARGVIDKNIDLELLMNKVELKHLMPPSSNVKKGIVSIIANISGNFDNIIHNETVQIENFELDDPYYNVKLDSLKYDSNKSNIVNVNNIVLSSDKIDNIKIPTLKLLIEKNNIDIPETKAYMSNSNLSLNGEIANCFKNLSYSLNLKGTINSKDIFKTDSSSVNYPVQALIYGNSLSHNLNSQIFIEKTDVFDEPVLLNILAKFDNSTIKIDELSLLPFSEKKLSDYKAFKGLKKALITGSINIAKEPEFKNLRIFIPQYTCIHIDDGFLQIKSDLFLNGKINSPEIIGQLLLQNLAFSQLQLSSPNISIDFNKNVAVINSQLIKFADSVLSINALLSTDFTKEVLIKNLSLKSKYLNTDTLLMYKDFPLIKAFPVKIVDGSLYSENLEMNVYGSQLNMTSFSSSIKLENSLLELKNIISDLFNGKLGGNLSYNLKHESFDTNLMFRGVSAAPMFNIISPRKESVSGVMDLDMNLQGELTSKQSLNGNIKFSVANGRMSTLGKLEHLLYAQNVVADNMLRTSLSVVTKAITLKDTGLFKYIQGDISMEKGIANINFIRSQGPHMALYIKGIYNPLTDFANLVVLGRISDEIMSGLGVFADFSLSKLMVMLTGEEAKLGYDLKDIEQLPQLSVKNTKEFRTLINGTISKPSSVALFNWISYTEKSFKQKEVPLHKDEVPDFIKELPY